MLASIMLAAVTFLPQMILTQNAIAEDKKPEKKVIEKPAENKPAKSKTGSPVDAEENITGDNKSTKDLKSKVPNVIVTIKPIHSIVAAVMGELGKPELLINKNSEHDYALKPSDMQKLQNADIIFYNSLNLESFLINTIPVLNKKTLAVELAASEDITRQKVTESYLSDDKDHDHGNYDQHIWLSPLNAVAIAKQVRKILAIKDPKNRGIYDMNTKNFINKVSEASEKITLKLSPYKNVPFIVFHDAFGYYVKNYGLNQVASVSIDPETPLSAEKISDINFVIKKKHIYCLFADPAFSEDALRKILNSGQQVKISTLDPIGVNLEAGSGLYVNLLNNITDNLLSCIKGND